MLLQILARLRRPYAASCHLLDRINRRERPWFTFLVVNLLRSWIVACVLVSFPGFVNLFDEAVRLTPADLSVSKFSKGFMGIIGVIMRWSEFWRWTPGPARKLVMLSAIGVSVFCYARACMTGPGKQTVCASQEYKGCTELLSGPPPPLARSPREPNLVRRVELSETYGLYTPAKPQSKASNASELDFSDLEALAESENSESTADFCAPTAELFALKQGVLWQSNVPSRWCETCQHFQLLRTKHCRDCGFCVTTYDHHCVWLGQCVGERNRQWFLVYCVAQQIEFLVVGRELLAIVFLVMNGVTDFLHVSVAYVLLRILWAVLALMIITFLYFLVVGLSFYHLFLMSSNLTTWEHERWDDITYLHVKPEYRGSPFYEGRWWGSLSLFFFHPEKQLPNRVMSRVAVPRRGITGAYLWEFQKQGGPRLFKNKRCNCYQPWS
ncbi:MAG: hypothetical protein KVP17_003492 [Porospora cf. gigantea B]|uniref:uncharacterized protein n=2 Tax=Porospora cf. gigantea B TaxID=2853592 RepID=UPI003571EF5B|nr:MAG: hypothetical protein KVP17_003492 [Porospora cf. gigantea B]